MFQTSWNKIKDWRTRFRKWITGVLVTIGIISVAIAAPPETFEIKEPKNLGRSPEIGLEEQLKNKTQEQKIELKSAEISKLPDQPRKNVKFSGEDFDVEIRDFTQIEGGVAFYARAWDKDGNQIGFGVNGSVEWERFKIYNPPVLVRGPSGKIEREIDLEDRMGNPYTITEYYREDPLVAMEQSLVHTISVMKHVHYNNEESIIRGKEGSTTSTFHPSAGEVEPVDGATNRTGVNQTFANIRAGAGNSSLDTGGGITVCQFKTTSVSSPNYDRWTRSIFGFDTSGLPDSDIISGATLSLFAHNAIDDGLGLSVVIDRNVPASTSALANSDFDVGNWDGVEQSSTRIDGTGWDIDDYRDWTLNPTGIGNIGRSGLTWYGTRCDADFDNSEPTWASTNDNFFVRSADQIGTSEDPKLIVEHAPPPEEMMFFESDI